MTTTPDPAEQAASRVERLLNPQRRAYLYRVAMAVLPLLVAVGALDAGLSSNIALLVAAVLGVGVPALANAHVQR